MSHETPPLKMSGSTIPDRLCDEIKARRAMGLKKYGVALKDAPLSRSQLLQHAKEEALDMAEYLQTLLDAEDHPAWPEEARIDNIGQNGNDGDHYELGTKSGRNK